ncbi:hypothetical protein B0H14DRAFT_3631997 [Mycena olivaceomarginata]|nr:hypothetical protein B0H14DRAFT_3631997 [Mycena olivaceomarginata]
MPKRTVLTPWMKMRRNLSRRLPKRQAKIAREQFGRPDEDTREPVKAPAKEIGNKRKVPSARTKAVAKAKGFEDEGEDVSQEMNASPDDADQEATEPVKAPVKKSPKSARYLRPEHIGLPRWTSVQCDPKSLNLSTAPLYRPTGLKLRHSQQREIQSDGFFVHACNSTTRCIYHGQPGQNAEYIFIYLYNILWGFCDVPFPQSSDQQTRHIGRRLLPLPELDSGISPSSIAYSVRSFKH